MRPARARRSLIICGAFLATVVPLVTGACSSGDSTGAGSLSDGSAGGEGGATDASDPTSANDSGSASDGAATGPTRAAFGLDSRAPNPTCKAGPRPATGAELAFEPVYAGLPQRPTLIGAYKPPNVFTHWYTLLRAGRIERFEDRADVNTYEDVLDLRDVVSMTGEGGLLGLAFHPAFATNHVAFVHYTTERADKTIDKSVLARVRSTDGGKTFDRGTLEPLLEVSQPYDNHKGGTIAFGPDGELYMAFGDGGGAGDNLRQAQVPTTLLGKMIRIHVEATGPYTIPADNPFVGTATRPEIWAIGFRNPYRWSFDRATGGLFVGDVGEALREEVDRVEKGGNYGWSEREGMNCYNGPIDNCVGEGNLIDPIFDYPHKAEFAFSAAIVGGYVYRGAKIPELVGAYVFGDYQEGRVYWARENANGAWTIENFFEPTGLSITTYAEDEHGEIFGLDYGLGEFRRLTRGAKLPPAAEASDRLSQTGCFDATDPKKPLPALVPYDVIAPFWSDGAEKTRWLALPDGTRATTNDDGDLDLPIGSVTAKEFRIGGKRVETRLFVRHDDGDWAGYSYMWNDAETEAFRVVGGAEKKVGSVSWRFPSGGQCLGCHTAAAGRTLGLELRQLARDVTYASTNRIAPQLDTLSHIGILDAPGNTTLPPLVDPAGDGPTDARARSYLHANCSHCHREGGPGRGSFSLLASTPTANVGCNAVPVAGTLGIADARVVAPGDAARSLVIHRASRRGAYAMPPLASTVADTEGVKLLTAWIGAMKPDCAP